MHFLAKQLPLLLLFICTLLFWLQAERLRLEYDKMESWKERRCRCCPSCGRTIEKLSGCDLILCGTCIYGCLLAAAP